MKPYEVKIITVTTETTCIRVHADDANQAERLALHEDTHVSPLRPRGEIARAASVIYIEELPVQPGSETT